LASSSSLNNERNMKQVAMTSRSGEKCLDFLLAVLRTVSSAGMANAGLQKRLLDCAQPYGRKTREEQRRLLEGINGHY
jgi:hypothetical protein